MTTCAIITYVLFVVVQVILTCMLIASVGKDNDSLYYALIYYCPLSHYVSFLLGVFGGYLFVHVRDRVVSVRAVWLVFSLTCGLLFTVLQYHLILPEIGGLTPVAYTPLFLPLFYSLFIVSLAFINYGINNGAARSFHWCDKAGKVSYAMYILQYPLYKLFLMMFPAFIKAYPDTGFFLYLTILIGVAIVAYNCIELPFKARLNITFQ